MNNYIVFATKRNKTNGARKYLIVDLITRVYAIEPSRMCYSKEELIEIKSADRRKLIYNLNMAKFSEVDNL